MTKLTPYTRRDEKTFRSIGETEDATHTAIAHLDFKTSTHGTDHFMAGPMGMTAPNLACRNISNPKNTTHIKRNMNASLAKGQHSPFIHMLRKLYHLNALRPAAFFHLLLH